MVTNHRALLRTRGNLNTWLVTEKIAFDVGGSTSIRDIILRTGGEFRNVYLDIRYSKGYIEVKTPTDEFKKLLVETYAGIRDWIGTNTVFLAIACHISGKIAPNLRIMKAFAFDPTIFT